MNLFTNRTQALLTALAVCTAVSLPCLAQAGVITLIDDNSSTTIDTQSQAGQSEWIVDGTNQLSQQSFWFRVGSTGPEEGLSSLLLAFEHVTDIDGDLNNDTLFTSYGGPGFTVEIRYTLHGGSPGSGSSDLAEQIRITNITDSNLDFHFFQYTNFDLLGTAAGDSAMFANANTVQQFEGPVALAETVVTPAGSHREAGDAAILLGQFLDAAATTLSDAPAFGVPVGPGDMAWAYQWDKVIAPGGVLQISLDKRVNVPEPASACMALAFCGLLGLRRR